MATTIGNLATHLTVNAQDLDAGLKAAQDKVKAFGVSIGAILGGIATIGFAKGLVDLATHTAQSIVAVDNQAKKFNVSMMEMASLQKFAGDRSEEFTHGLSHLNRLLGEAAQGNEAAAGAFGRLGLDFEKLANLSGFERVRSLLDYFKALPDEMSKAAAAQDLFGKSGVEMVDILQRGAGALDAVTERMAKYYKEVFNVENADQMRTFLREQKELTEAWEGFKARVGIGLVQMWQDAKESSGEFWRLVRHGFNQADADLEAMNESLARRNAAREVRPVTAVTTKPRGWLDEESGPEDFLQFSTGLDRIRQITEATNTPLDKLNIQMIELDRALAEGAIDAEVYSRSVLNLYQALDKLESQHKFAPAALAGSQAAYTATIQHDFTKSETPEARLERINKQMLEEQQRTTNEARKIVEALRKQPGLVPAAL